MKPKAEMTLEELEKLEQEEFNAGPMQVLVKSVKENTQVGLEQLHHYCLAFLSFVPRP